MAEKSIYLDSAASEYLWCPDDAALRMAGDLSLHCHFRPDAVAQLHSLISKTDGVTVNKNYMLWYDATLTRLNAKLYSSGLSEVQRYVTADLGTDFHGVTFTWDASEDDGKFFVDGAQVGATQTFGFTALHSAGTARLTCGGRDFSGTPQDFAKGWLDDVQVWSRLLTDAEVASGWRALRDGTESGLELLLRLDDDTTDETANGLNGTFVGTATYSTIRAALGGSSVSAIEPRLIDGGLKFG